MTSPDRPPVVAIDGPVGVGKSTVARRVAERLGFQRIDTGAMYRAVAWRYLQIPEPDRQPARMGEIAYGLDMSFEPDGSVRLDGEDVTAHLRDEEVSRNVYLSADDMDVRKALVAQQRRIGLRRPSVLEGRDIGTVVFPDARWKIYLDAESRERARRRALQLEQMGREADLDRIAADLEERDERDRSRIWGALRKAEDAILLDSTSMTEDEVVDWICNLVHADMERGLPPSP